MGRSFLEPGVRRVLIIQIASIALLSAVVLVSSGQLNAISALAGGGAVFAGNLAYAVIARPSRVNAKSGSAVLMVHVIAQSAKMVLVLVSLLAAFASGQCAAGLLVIGTGVALLAHWLSLLFHR
jgi:F0F1-type ATP synthase assembly protein I